MVAEEISQRSNLLEWSVRTPTREAVSYTLSIHYPYTIYALSMLYPRTCLTESVYWMRGAAKVIKRNWEQQY